jgi:hypothetical protein
MKDFVSVDDAVRVYKLDEGGWVGKLNYPSATDWRTWHLNRAAVRTLINASIPLVALAGPTGSSKTVHLLAAGFRHAVPLWSLSRNRRTAVYAKGCEIDLQRNFDAWTIQYPEYTLFLIDDIHDDPETTEQFVQTFFDRDLTSEGNRLVLAGRVMPEGLARFKIAVVHTPFSNNDELTKATAATANVALAPEEVERITAKALPLRFVLYGARHEPSALRAGTLDTAWGAAEESKLGDEGSSLFDTIALLHLLGLGYRSEKVGFRKDLIERLERQGFIRKTSPDQPSFIVDDETAVTWLAFRTKARFNRIVKISCQGWLLLSDRNPPLATTLLSRGLGNPKNIADLLHTLHIHELETANLPGALVDDSQFREAFATWTGKTEISLSLRIRALSSLPAESRWVAELTRKQLGLHSDEVRRGVADADLELFIAIARIRNSSLRETRRSLLRMFVGNKKFDQQLSVATSALRERCLSIIEQSIPERLTGLLDFVSAARQHEISSLHSAIIWRRLSNYFSQSRTHGIRIIENLSIDFLKGSVIRDPREAYLFVRNQFFTRTSLGLVPARDSGGLVRQLTQAVQSVNYTEGEFRHWNQGYDFVNWINLCILLSPNVYLDSTNFRKLLHRAVLTPSGGVLSNIVKQANTSAILPRDFLAQKLEESLVLRRPPLSERIYCLWRLDQKRVFELIPAILRERPAPPNVKQAFWLIWNSWLAALPIHRNAVKEYADWLRSTATDPEFDGTEKDSVLFWLAFSGLLEWLTKKPALSINLDSIADDDISVESATATAFELYSIARADLSATHFSVLDQLVRGLAKPQQQLRHGIRNMRPRQRTALRRVYQNVLQAFSARSEFRKVLGRLQKVIGSFISETLGGD